MPANMMSAPVGSSFTVSGSSIATVSAGPTPGSTPTAVPSVTPMNPHSRLSGFSATSKPESSALKVSTSDSRAAEQRREPARGQIHVEEFHEEQEHHQGNGAAEREIACDARAAETARDAREQQGAGDHEAGVADQCHVRAEACSHPNESRRVEGVIAALG